jgi:fructokinase
MLGHRVAPIITLGTDLEGDFLVREFHRAGGVTDLICRKSDRRSPVIVEPVDPLRAQHWFSSMCPETLEALPQWRSIGAEQVLSARGVLEKVSFFYVDRLSRAIVLAMEAANNAGALVFFEPAGSYEEALLARALRAVSILKVSDDTRGVEIYGSETTSLTSMLVIRTHGTRGLTVTFDGTERFSPAHPAERLIDSCGSGDMVTTGILNYLLRRSSNRIEYSAGSLRRYPSWPAPCCSKLRFCRCTGVISCTWPR